MKATEFPIAMIGHRPIEFRPMSPQTGRIEFMAKQTPESLR